MSKNLPNYTRGEEIFSAVTHIVGGGFGILVLILCLVFGIPRLEPLGIASVVIYGISIILLYTMSTLYHFLANKNAKRVFRIFDHCTIFVLIAGTYTPICGVLLKNQSLGIILMIILWALAILGIIFNAINMHAKIIKVMSMILYISMGWCAVFAIAPLMKVWTLEGFLWMLSGGIAYTIGVIFYAFGKKARYIHSVWHIFVFLGTFLQFISVFFYIILA